MDRWWMALLPSWLRRWIWKAGQAAIVAVRKWQIRRLARDNAGRPGPPPIEPIWPLPRRAGGPSDQEIRARFAPPNLWHYDYRFEGGLSFQSRHATPTPYLTPELALGSFRHFMPWLLEACGGTLAGKRVLDIGF